MRLSEALAIFNRPWPENAETFRVALACSFTALHLRTFLAARLRCRLPRQRVEVETGLYGDLLGTLERLAGAELDCAVVVLEWPDLDQRLGLRNLGGWRESAIRDILETAQVRLAACQETIGRISEKLPVVLSLPTLPLMPLEPTASTLNSGALQTGLQESLSRLAAWASRNPAIQLVNSDRVNRLSAFAERLDVKSELLNGFPYSLNHASALSEILATLIHPPARKKGIITDLDNTLWKGLVGELGTENVSWDRTGHMHGVYQELLGSLSRAGVLVGVASKNDPALVEGVFRRKDIRLDRNCVFPLEVHWAQKSESVSRILQTWNVGPDSVVFIDDNPAELAEVKAAHPAVECFQFPSDPQAVYELLSDLRDLFAKPVITEEDRIRAASIRASRQAADSSEPRVLSEALLERAESVLTLDFDKSTWDPRVLELINKTNQFNLNGKRWTESTLRRELSEQDSFLLKASYNDKFSPLGKIAVMVGRLRRHSIRVSAWVMSCRAFSRRIEHACLDQLFRTFDVEEIEFDFAPTERNKPLQEFFEDIVARPLESPLLLSKTEFGRRCPRLFHKVENDLWMTPRSA